MTADGRIHDGRVHDGRVHDVVVLGGGAAGLTLALQLRDRSPGMSVLVVERSAGPAPESAHKVGESTVEIAAHYLRDVLGLGHHLETEQLNKFGLRVFFTDGDNSDIGRRVELGHAVCPPHGVGTYQLDRGRFENALAAELALRGIDHLTDARAEHVELGTGPARSTVRIRRGDETFAVHARWVVDATGRSSLLKRQLGLGKDVGHHANAVWFRIADEIDVDDWSGDPRWHGRIREGQRRLSTNHLMGRGYWVWLIPLASGSTSVGIVTDPRHHDFAGLNRLDRALDWLDRHEPQCARAVRDSTGPVQDFRVMKDYAYSSEQVFSADGWCLAGEAGVFLDPLYSPGLDLIAISNGLITDLIVRAVAGEDVTDVAAVHNQVFFLLADGWMRVYEDQYGLMDNARVMIAKAVWDTAVYWAVPGLLYFHGVLPSLIDRMGVVLDLARFSALGEHMQRFFREWHAVADREDRDRFVGFYDFDFMPALHVGMTAGLDDAALQQQFGRNVDLVEHLSGHLIAFVLEDLTTNAPDDAAGRRLVEDWSADPEFSRLLDLARADPPAANPWRALDGVAATR